MTPKDFATKWFGALDSKNYDVLKSMLSPSHKFDNPMTPQPVDGATHLGITQQMNSSFSEGRHTIDQMVCEGDWVTVRATWSGKHTGDFNGVPPTGKTITLKFIDLMHVVNNQLNEEYMMFDMQSFIGQVAGAAQTA